MGRFQLPVHIVAVTPAPPAAAMSCAQGATKFASVLAQAAAALSSSVGVAEPDAALLATLDLRGGPQAFAKAAAEPELAGRFTALLGQWGHTVEQLLGEALADAKDAEEAGPELELEFWRRRMTRLNTIQEQLRSAESRAVVGVCSATKAGISAVAQWQELEQRLADAAAESRETVKYLGTLEASLECLYTREWRDGERDGEQKGGVTCSLGAGLTVISCSGWQLLAAAAAACCLAWLGATPALPPKTAALQGHPPRSWTACRSLPTTCAWCTASPATTARWRAWPPSCAGSPTS